MLTRIWQYRYYGLIATFLLGLSAAVIVMLLPDRQQAFARFSLDNAAASTLTSSNRFAPVGVALLNNENVLTKVLQRFDVEAPNPVDPRTVDPADAYQRNFSLRQIGVSDEYEISYVGRTADKAALGVKTWLEAASEVVAGAHPVVNFVPDDEVDAPDFSGLQQALDQAQADLKTSETKESKHDKTLQDLQAEVLRAREKLEQTEAKQSALAAAREKQKAAQAEFTKAQEQAQTDAADKVAGAETLQSAAADRLRDAGQQLDNAKEELAALVANKRQATQAGAAANESAASEHKALKQREQLLRRQALALQTKINRAESRSAELVRRISATPDSLTVIVQDETPAASQQDPAALAQLALANAELEELRVRFTDSHPDVRRQLSIVAELKQRANVAPLDRAPTVAAHSESSPNPAHQKLVDAHALSEKALAALRKRQAGIQRAQKKNAAQLAAQAKAKPQQVVAAQPDEAERKALEQAISAAQSEVADAESKLAEADTALADARREAADAMAAAGVDTASDDTALKALADEHEGKTKELAELESQLDVARSAFEVSRFESRQARESVEQAGLALQSAQNKTPSVAGTDGSTAVPESISGAGLFILSSTQVVPASSNPDRPRWLWMSLLASLVLGALAALVASLRPTGIHSVSELEKITGLRALGGVPRFATRGRSLAALIGVLCFAAILLAYVLVYVGFIGLVDLDALKWPLDWMALQDWARSLVFDAAARLGLDASMPGLAWLSTEGGQ